MKKLLFILLLFSIFSYSTTMGKDRVPEKKKKSALVTGRAAAASSSEAVSLSMFSWGIGLGVFIGVLCALLPQSKGASAHS